MLKKQRPNLPSRVANKAKSRVGEGYADTMLIRILSFLLETIFFLLIGASLLRAWMNWMRVNMRAQPGSFVMALTDWLVKPLRRVLPAQVLKSRIDWASVIAAILFALVYALLWSVLFGLLLGAVNAMPDFAPAAIIGLVVFALPGVLMLVGSVQMIRVRGYRWCWAGVTSISKACPSRRRMRPTTATRANSAALFTPSTSTLSR